MEKEYVTIDGNEAAAYVAYHVNEVITIYPITPSSPMGELADEWSVKGEKNIWGTVPRVTEMQSEAGAAGAVHGSLQAGSLTTTFTASQGLLLMIPNMYKIAGELTSTVFHVSARTIATHALSIFGDQSDVMATRSTGFALLASNNVQEVMDFALIAQASTLKSRIPFLHFFDGFRTSHETLKVKKLKLEHMRAMIDDELVRGHRTRALSPERPFIRGTAHNPDTFFQAREAINPYYYATPQIVQESMDLFYRLTKRQYYLYQYHGSPDAENIIVLMGSGAEAVHETVDYLIEKGEKVGVVKVRLYRPFSVSHFMASLPRTTKVIAVLDRTKEPGSAGEPLYLDVVNALAQTRGEDTGHLEKDPQIVGGRYGLSSKEFNASMINGIFQEMKKKDPKKHFTIGIDDDVSHTSLDYDPDFSVEPKDRTRAVFYGIGADGTVSANKNSIKIIGEQTENFAQGYFVYDSRKAGSLTISHLRFGKQPILSTYCINKANFVACHQFPYLTRFDLLKIAEPGAIFLLNSPYPKESIWDHLPKTAQQHIIDKKLHFFVIDAYKIAREVGLDVRINTIMQTCFFALTNVIPKEQALASIKEFIRKSYGGRGEAVVNMNFAGVDQALKNLHEVNIPDHVTSSFDIRPAVPSHAPEFVKRVTARMISHEGDDLPVSAFIPDGTFPSGTAQWEKRNIAREIPVWDPEVCIQCGKCSLACPHAVIRAKIYDAKYLDSAPVGFKSTECSLREFSTMSYTIQVSPEDCTGCRVCVEVCPAKNKKVPKLKAINMTAIEPILKQESRNWHFFLDLPEAPRETLRLNAVRDVQFLEPLFEFSGACAGCGETPYLALLTKLFGDRALVANATGCSSIYGGNLPATPWTTNRDGRGPAWSNSLFEDNAEFGLGMRLALDQQIGYARELLEKLSTDLGNGLVSQILHADQATEQGIKTQRQYIKILKEKLKSIDKPEAIELGVLCDVLVKKDVWVVGGDGWAYDIGYGGLDHVLALGHDVNLLVLDSEVYSNTGGQMSKATPLGAVAKFAAGGKSVPKKDLGAMAMIYGNTYVAQVALGANDAHTIKAFLEAESYPGPSLIIAYSHCIAHGYDLAYGMNQQRLAVSSGYWPLFRYDPRLTAQGKNPLQLDSSAPKIPLDEYIYNETRYKMLTHANPEIAKQLLKRAQETVQRKWRYYQHWASMDYSKKDNHG